MRLHHRRLHKLFRAARPALFLSKTSIDTVKNETPNKPAKQLRIKSRNGEYESSYISGHFEGFLATNETLQKGLFAIKNLGFPHSL